jgi:hypothetical protein
MKRREHDKTQQALAGIAAEHLGIETLETRNSDSLDFHEVSVWSLQAALEAAFQAGRQAGPATIHVGKDIKTYAGQEARITRAFRDGNRTLYALKTCGGTLATAWDEVAGLEAYAAEKMLVLKNEGN